MDFPEWLCVLYGIHSKNPRRTHILTSARPISHRYRCCYPRCTWTVCPDYPRQQQLGMLLLPSRATKRPAQGLHQWILWEQTHRPNNRLHIPRGMPRTNVTAVVLAPPCHCHCHCHCLCYWPRLCQACIRFARHRISSRKTPGWKETPHPPNQGFRSTCPHRASLPIVPVGNRQMLVFEWPRSPWPRQMPSRRPLRKCWPRGLPVSKRPKLRRRESATQGLPLRFEVNRAG
mmetsp:Transcript_791/g.1933  ORF Transcript_791/g.1933 Transcript_791/m.1933 type:complete len:231 (+) Transcript_791:114-806(+)